MRMNWLLISCLVLLLLGTTACVMQQGQNITQITVKVGDDFVIKLDANPTTGYQWQIKQEDSSSLKLVDSSFIPPRTNLVGAGGEQVFKFQALKPGETKLILVYLRPWEKVVAPIETREFRIAVKT